MPIQTAQFRKYKLNRKQAKVDPKVEVYRAQQFAAMLMTGHKGTDVITRAHAVRAMTRFYPNAATMSASELQFVVNHLLEIIPIEERPFVHVEGAECPPFQRSSRYSGTVADDLEEIAIRMGWLRKDLGKKRSALLGI